MQVGLVIIDEIHLLGEDRGPVLEVIVSRMRYISTQTNSQVRFMGMSTAIANAKDVADWLGVPQCEKYLWLYIHVCNVHANDVACHLQPSVHLHDHIYIYIHTNIHQGHASTSTHPCVQCLS